MKCFISKAFSQMNNLNIFTKKIEKMNKIKSNKQQKVNYKNETKSYTLKKE